VPRERYQGFATSIMLYEKSCRSFKCRITNDRPQSLTRFSRKPESCSYSPLSPGYSSELMYGFTESNMCKKDWLDLLPASITRLRALNHLIIRSGTVSSNSKVNTATYASRDWLWLSQGVRFNKSSRKVTKRNDLTSVMFTQLKAQSDKDTESSIRRLNTDEIAYASGINNNIYVLITQTLTRYCLIQT
jgi:hypothetical protein